MQPFVAVGDYTDIRRLARPNSFEFEPATIPFDPDFNRKSLRGNIVLRWEYVRGSTLFFVWNMSTLDRARWHPRLHGQDELLAQSLRARPFCSLGVVGNGVTRWGDDTDPPEPGAEQAQRGEDGQTMPGSHIPGLQEICRSLEKVTLKTAAWAQ